MEDWPVAQSLRDLVGPLFEPLEALNPCSSHFCLHTHVQQFFCSLSRKDGDDGTRTRGLRHDGMIGPDLTLLDRGSSMPVALGVAFQAF